MKKIFIGIFLAAIPFALILYFFVTQTTNTQNTDNNAAHLVSEVSEEEVITGDDLEEIEIDGNENSETAVDTQVDSDTENNAENDIEDNAGDNVEIENNNSDSNNTSRSSSGSSSTQTINGSTNTTTNTTRNISRSVIQPLKAWIRAKITYEYDDGIRGLNDHLIRFDSRLWKRGNDGWYYYSIPVSSGDKIGFIKGITLPDEWDSDVENKEFSVIVTVEASEVKSGDAGWNKNSSVAYKKDYCLMTSSSSESTINEIRNGGMKVTIKEYQKEEDGSIVPYENDKLVVPGQYVSKIVEFELHKTLIPPTGDHNMLIPYALLSMISIFIIYKKCKLKKEI